jgi:CxxC-x17-CxxC domain-containing protein
MNDFKRNDRFGGKRAGGFGKKDFGGRPSFGGKPGYKGGGGFSRPQGEMHEATCAECGKSCQVPFRPNGTRPVYCSNCFGGKTPMAPREFSKPSFRAPVPAAQPQAPDPRIDGVIRHLAKIEAKLDQILVAMAVAKAQAGVAVSEAKPKKSPKKK